MRVDEGLLARAVDALEVTDADPSARRVLDAARAAIERDGIQATTMDDVARAAGVGRATVYRKFANRDALVQAVVLDDLLRYLDRLDQVMDAAGGLTAQLVEGYVETLRWIREESLLRAVVERDGDWGMRFFTVAAGPVLGTARSYLGDRLRRVRGGVEGPVPTDQVAELLVRLCHSLMLTPDGVIPNDDDEASRAFARAVLVPLVGAD